MISTLIELGEIVDNMHIVNANLCETSVDLISIIFSYHPLIQ